MAIYEAVNDNTRTAWRPERARTDRSAFIIYLYPVTRLVRDYAPSTILVSGKKVIDSNLSSRARLTRIV